MRHRTSLRLRRFRLCRFEALECRQVLSASIGLPDGLLLHPQIQVIRPHQSATPVGYTPAQIKKAYGFDQIKFNGTIPGDGRGTTIAIVDAYNNPTIVNDLKVFDKAFGLPDPPSFKLVNQWGGSNLPLSAPAAIGDFPGGWDAEIALDVEWAHAIAPAANILLVLAADSSYTNLLTAVNYASRAAGVVVVSNSWGGVPVSGGKLLRLRIHDSCGHTPVSFVFSAGDAGGYASYPASSRKFLALVEPH